MSEEAKKRPIIPQEEADTPVEGDSNVEPTNEAKPAKPVEPQPSNPPHPRIGRGRPPKCGVCKLSVSGLVGGCCCSEPDVSHLSPPVAQAEASKGSVPGSDPEDGAGSEGSVAKDSGRTKTEQEPRQGRSYRHRSLGRRGAVSVSPFDSES